MELFVKIFTGFQPVAIFTENSVIDVWIGSDASVLLVILKNFAMILETVVFRSLGFFSRKNQVSFLC